MESKSVFTDLMETIVKKFGVTTILIIEDENVYVEMKKLYYNNNSIKIELIKKIWTVEEDTEKKLKNIEQYNKNQLKKYFNIKLTIKQIPFDEFKLFKIEKSEFINNYGKKTIECKAVRIDLHDKNQSQIKTKIIGFIYLTLTKHDLQDYEHD